MKVPVPLSCTMVSRVCRTAPVVASTSTTSRLAPSVPIPSTVDSHASVGAVSSAYTTRWVSSIPLTDFSVAAAAFSAMALASRGFVPRPAMTCFCATEVELTRPDGSTTTTKSPPTTGRPRYVRSYGTYRQPCDATILCWTNASSGPARRYAGLPATRFAADVLAGPSPGLAGGAGGGPAEAVGAVAPARAVVVATTLVMDARS